HARHQRHALRNAAGLQQRRAVFRLPARRLQRALHRGRSGGARCAQSAVDRAALPHRRRAGPARGARPLPRLHPEPRCRLDRAPHRHRPALACGASVRGEDMTLAELNARDRRGFVVALGGVFEDSPWVAEAAWPRHPLATLDALYRAMVDAVRSAGEDAQLALIRAHRVVAPGGAGRRINVPRPLTLTRKWGEETKPLSRSGGRGLRRGWSNEGEPEVTTAPSVHPVDEVLPYGQMAAVGLQHVLVMYAGAIAVPLIVGGALKLPKEQIAFLINAYLFACGIATLIQCIGFWRIGIRLPVVMGVTFA